MFEASDIWFSFFVGMGTGTMLGFLISLAVGK
jgi:hypothetical protein